MEETFLVDQSCLFKLDQQKLDAIVELKSTTAPNYLDPITARNIAFASSKCINGKAFVLVLRTREETVFYNKINLKLKYQKINLKLKIRK
ncbi:hypothetical protein Mgra_00008788 [Meloidogyne graminicola]|uniref:Uncharacterized protein n=1 Tax=Meloidogyne graminicola TaxID=189291 RepID=A0A8S9ZEP9_9BILA|nr:hypothetical protein Mgra_00008788 [Meloidogyne graminicola]